MFKGEIMNTTSPSFYDEHYYEHGIESGKSAYVNYRWSPELTIPMAMTIVDYLGIKQSDKVLDFGCAKGYLVKALRLLNRQAYGYDVSTYALSHVPEDVREYCSNGKYMLDVFKYDYIIAKDVFEHLSPLQLEELFQEIDFNKLFVVLPLGNNGEYIAPANNMDKSHILCLSKEEWNSLFMKNNLTITEFTYMIKGIKDSYYSNHPEAHGFWVLERNKI
jgi:hypothetical protein